MTKSVKRTVKGKLGGGLKKLSKGADWLGAIAGYAGTINAAAASWGAEFWSGMVDVHVNAVTRHNVGKLTDVPYKMGDPNINPLFLGGAIAAVGGWAATVIPNIVPYQSTVGSIVSKAGVGMVIGSALSMVTLALAEGSSPFDRGTGTATTTNRKMGTARATTSGLVGYPRKYLATYPATHTSGWAMPRD